MKNYLKIFFLVAGIIISACSPKPFVPDEKFVGKWAPEGRKMYEGLEITIVKEKDKLRGRLTRLNDNKYIKMFSDSNDTWVSNIKRISNFEFRLTERKPGADFMSLYGLSGSQEFKALFIDDNTIGLAAEGADPLKSTIVYKRLK